MLTSKEALLKEAREKGYKPEILEKVYRLLNTFQQIMSVPYLQERLVLKGGTALNLFCFQKAPRLSVDIDLNYVGELNREAMLEDRKVLTESIQLILQQNQFEPYRSPTNYAGGKMVWYYNSVLGQRGSLEIDINFMHRQPLWPIALRPANIVGYENWKAPVLDIHELTAGKLAALFDRRVSRDLFDAHYLLTQTDFDWQKLRLSYVVYLAMTGISLSDLKPEMVEYDLMDLRNRLLPVLHQQALPRQLSKLKEWVEHLTQELKEKLNRLLPLEENEEEFIKVIRQEHLIKPELITSNSELSDKIKSLPALLWAVKKSENII